MGIEFSNTFPKTSDPLDVNARILVFLYPKSMCAHKAHCFSNKYTCNLWHSNLPDTNLNYPSVINVQSSPNLANKYQPIIFIIFTNIKRRAQIFQILHVSAWRIHRQHHFSCIHKISSFIIVLTWSETSSKIPLTSVCKCEPLVFQYLLFSFCHNRGIQAFGLQVRWGSRMIH